VGWTPDLVIVDQTNHPRRTCIPVEELGGRPGGRGPLFPDVWIHGKHHVSAVCTLAPIVMTRIAACWRNGERYILRDVDGRAITEAEGRAICRERYTVTAADRQQRRQPTTAKQHKGRTGRRGKESTEAAPAADPSRSQTTQPETLAHA
jgi:hypothetical protein